MSREPDVAVIGAGLIGCACAYSLARRGLHVTVYEREDVASGASGACDGHVCCQSKLPGLHLDLARQSLERYRTLSDELGEQTGFRQCGSRLVAETEEEWEALGAATRTLQAGGLEVELHSGADLCAAEPILSPSLAGGSFCPTDGQTDPWRTTLAYFHAAQRAGARFELGCEVRQVVAERGRVRGVRTNGGTASAGSVLICAGAWTQALCETVGVRAPVRPRRGDLLVTEAMPPMVRSVLLHAPYVAGKRGNAGLRPATLVVEQIEEGNLLIGSTRVYAGFEVRVSAEGVAAISEEAQRLAPGLRRLHVIRAFGGLRPCSGDGLPLVGPVSRVEGLHVAAGHEGDGVALAPVTGQLVADGMLGGAWLPALRVERPAAEPR